jgi:hypothetical protein
MSNYEAFFTFTDPTDGTTSLRAYYGEIAATDRAEWEPGVEWELLRFIGTNQASAHVYHQQYILTQEIVIGDQASYDNLALAHQFKPSGTWQYAGEAFTSVIIDAFQVPRRQDCDGVWRGTIVWRRLAG